MKSIPSIWTSCPLKSLFSKFFANSYRTPHYLWLWRLWPASCQYFTPADVVLGLANSPRLFVRVLGAVGGIITMSDLQKPPVRMWLFGMVTLLEMRTSRLIELKCPGDSWKQYLSESRLQKAEALLEERKRRNQNLELIDCLQISDKGQIIARNEEIRCLTRMQSRRQAEQAIKMLESLRNNLAHSQDIISCDWGIIVWLCRDMERVISGTEEVQQALAEQ